jgi:hypothetical protein
MEIGGAFKMELVAHISVRTPDSAAEFPLSDAVSPGAAGMRYARD